ncbi:MAG: hypothetical protein ACM3OO_05760 [Planctomycetaceae bacterium]
MRLWGERVETLDVVLDIAGLLLLLLGLYLLVAGVLAPSILLLIFGALAVAAALAMLRPEFKRFRKARQKGQGGA